jgi:hypothetical protein
MIMSLVFTAIDVGMPSRGEAGPSDAVGIPGAAVPAVEVLVSDRAGFVTR